MCKIVLICLLIWYWYLHSLKPVLITFSRPLLGWNIVQHLSWSATTVSCWLLVYTLITEGEGGLLDACSSSSSSRSGVEVEVDANYRNLRTLAFPPDRIVGIYRDSCRGTMWPHCTPTTIPPLLTLLSAANSTRHQINSCLLLLLPAIGWWIFGSCCWSKRKQLLASVKPTLFEPKV